MNILIAEDLLNNGNEYTKNIKHILQTIDDSINVFCSSDDFWYTSNKKYDFVIVSFPHRLILMGELPGIVDEIKKQLLFYKKQGTRIVFVVHDKGVQNFTKSWRYDTQENMLINDLFAFLHRQADILWHLGNYSIDWHRETFGIIDGQQHYVVPHPLYQNFKFDIDQASAKRQLGIKQDEFMVLAAGEVRNKQELELAITLYKQLNIDKKHLLFQNLYYLPEYRSRRINPYIKLKFDIRRKFHKIDYSAGWKTPDEVSLFYAAADLVLISREINLNSGNVILAAQFNKPFVAMEAGNITEWTRALSQWVVSKETLEVPTLEQIEQMQASNPRERIEQLCSDEVIRDALRKSLFNE